MDHHNEFIRSRLTPPKLIPSRIVYPENGEVRARKVVRRSNHGHVVKFASLKCRRLLELESLLEYDRAILLEMDPEVSSFQEQPFMIEYGDRGIIKKIYPDLLVHRFDGSKTIVEVKPSRKATEPEFCRRADIERAILARHGYRFEVHTEREIRLEPQLTNAKKLLPYRWFPANSLLREAVLNELGKGRMDGYDLLERLPELTFDVLLTLLAHGKIVTDLSIPLGLATEFESNV